MIETKRPKVLYLYAGSRKEFYEKWKKGKTHGADGDMSSKGVGETVVSLQRKADPSIVRGSLRTEGSQNNAPLSVMPDTQLLGLNYMKELGIDAEFLEWPLAEWLRKVNFNLVHLPYLFALPRYDIAFICAGLPLVFIAKYLLQMKIKFVIYNTYLTNALKRNPTGFLGFITRKAIENIDMVVCTGKEQETFLLENGFDATKITFLPIGIDAARFAAETTERADPGSYILAVGRDPGRDYKTFFVAVRSLPTKVKVATKLEVVAGLEIPQNVELLLNIPYEKMPSLYQGALCAVVPLRDWNDPKGSDTSGQYGYLEPMASGKAVIASDKSVVRDYIENDVDSILVPPGDPKALREAIEKLIADGELRRRLGAAAQKKVLERFTSKKFAEALAHIFKKSL